MVMISSSPGPTHLGYGGMEAALKHAVAILYRKRDKQREATPRWPRVTCAWLPTGFGKSCFHCLPLVNDSPSCHETSIVVVELMAAVMRDHVETLLAKGRRAAFINHEQ